MRIKKLWQYFTSNKIHAEFIKFGFVGFLGSLWMFVIMWFIIDFLKLQINFWFIDTWKFSFGIATFFAFIHNFFLNKLLGGLSRIK